MYGGVPLSSDYPSKQVVDWAQLCGPGSSECSEEEFGLPPAGISLVEVHSGQAEAWAHESSCGLNLIGMVGQSAYLCDDLGIDDETFCTDVEEVQPGLVRIILFCTYILIYYKFSYSSFHVILFSIDTCAQACLPQTQGA